MLTTLTSRPGTRSGPFLIRTPKLLFSLPHTVLIEDLPSSLTVKAYLSQHGPSITPATAHTLGCALGSWLREYHAWLNGEHTKDLREKLAGNTAMVDAREGLYIGSYKMSIERFPEIETWPDEGEFIEIERAVKGMVRDSERREGIHGDFWTGNMILEDKPLPLPISNNTDVDAAAAAAPKDQDPAEIFILDFEVSQLGSRAQDLAQCLAELYMVHHFYGASSPLQVMQGVAEAYTANRGKPADDTGMDYETTAFQTAMHFGIHIVVIPWQFGWPMGDEMGSCLTFGYECVLRGWRRDAEWFRGGPLECLFTEQ
jgi:hypothetical protein